MSMLHHVTPQNTGKSIAIGEANRYVRTNSDRPHYNAMTKHLTEKLRQRGYKTRNIHSYISLVNYSDRAKKLKNKPIKDTANRLVFSTKYCDNIHNLRRFLTVCWKELHKSEELKEYSPIHH